MSPERNEFFVSYTGADKAWAVWIAYELEAAGHSVVIQAWDFRPGSNFVLEMHKALQQCERMIAVLSPAYLAAGYPQPEWAGSFAGDPKGTNKNLVPVMVERCDPDGLLNQVVHVRIHDLDEVQARGELLSGINAGRAKPDAAPSFPGRSPAPTSPGPRFPAVTAEAVRASAPVTWVPRASSPDIRWRTDLDGSISNQRRVETVELHVAPTDDSARLQMRELGALEALLPDHGRQHRLFTGVEALTPTGCV